MNAGALQLTVLLLLLHAALPSLWKLKLSIRTAVLEESVTLRW